MVVTVVAMLTIVVTEFTYSVTIDQYRVRNSLHALQAELIVRSGVNLVEGFLSLDEDPDIDTRTDEWYIRMIQFCENIELPDGSLIRCDVKDESGKINVNNTARSRTRPRNPDVVDDEAVVEDALRCIFQRRDGLDVEVVDDLIEYWMREPPTLADGTSRNRVPYFQSLEDFAAEFNIKTRHLRYLRKYVTAQPRRQLRGVNINIAEPEVLSALINPNPDDQCGRTAEVDDILERQLDPEDPIKQVDVRTLLSGLENSQAIVGTFVVKSSLYRLEASAITNPDPENPTRGGVGKTLSVLIFRECPEKDGDGNCERWTLKPLDWQKEGGARLFRESNRFSEVSEYYEDFDPSALGDLFN